MSLNYLSRLITISILLLCIGGMSASWQSDTSRRLAAEAEQQREKVADLAATLLEGNQRLTQLARQYIASNDERYRRLHERESSQEQTFEKSLQRLLEMPLSDVERLLLGNVQQIHAAQALVEQEAMQLRARGEHTVLLANPTFIYSEALLGNLLVELRSSAKARLDRQVTLAYQQTQHFQQFANAVKYVLLLTIVGSLILLRYRMIRPLLSLTEQTRRLQLGEPLQEIALPGAPSELRDLAQALDGYREVNLRAEQRAWVDRCLGELGQVLQGCSSHADFAAVLRERLCGMLPCREVQLLTAAEATAESPAVDLVHLPLRHAEQELGALQLSFAGTLGVEQQLLLQRLVPALGQWLALQQQREHKLQLLASLEERQLVLQATENWYRGIIQAAPDGLLVFDEAGRVTLANAESERIFGYAPGQLLGQNFKVLVPQHQHELLAGILSDYFDGRQSQRLEGVAQRRNGAEFPIEIRLSDLPSLDGLGLSMCVVIRDLSLSKAQERRLIRAHEEQQAMLTAAPHGIALVREGLIVQANPRLHELFGHVGDGALLGTSPAAWVAVESCGRLEKEIRQQLAEGETYHCELQVCRRDGSPFFATISARAVHPRELSQGSIWIVEDASLQHAARQEMAEARELAEAAARVKAEFLANMSHEIRTPMNAIIGMTHLLAQTTLDWQQRDYLDKVQGANRHLLGIVNDILDFSKIEAGKLDLDIQDFALAQLLTEVTDQVRPGIESKGLNLFVEVAGDLPLRLSGDALRLRQVLLNYLSNAAKFTERGHILVQVDASPLPEERLLVRFRVTDTGIGLDQEQCSHLFQSFSQADATTTRRYGGTGLGLAIARQLSELMGGEVAVSSSPGEGSCFSFTANLAAASSCPVVQEQRSPAAVPQFAGVRILLVEDNEMNQQVASELLRATGCQVDVAGNGQIALECLEQRPYQLVFMDMQMPVLDGLGCIRLLRQHDAWRELPVIAMTASALVEDRDSCLSAGMNDFIGKPLEPGLLFELLRRWLPDYLGAPAVTSSAPLGAGLDLAALRAAGLDTQAALRRMLGREDLYLELLRKYQAAQPGLLEELQAALAATDRARARALAHACKGVSANIGAEAVAASAAELEQALRGETAAGEATLYQRFATSLRQLLAALAQNLPAEPELQVATSFDGAALRAAGEQLAELLEECNAAAVSQFQAHRSLFGSACAASCQALDEALRRFDFDQAKVALGRIMQQSPQAA